MATRRIIGNISVGRGVRGEKGVSLYLQMEQRILK